MSKKHHYVPQSVLRGFASDPEQRSIFVFDKKTGRSFEAAIADTGSENQFNTVIIDGVDVNFEKAFQDVDNRLALLLKRLRSSKSLSVLSTEDEIDLAYMASIQLIRTKIIRTSLTSFSQQVKDGFKAIDIEIPDNALPDVDSNLAKMITLKLMSDAKEYVSAFIDKDWTLLAAPAGHSFWISDNPVATFNGFPYGRWGLQSYGVQIFWPIGQELSLQFACPSIAEKMGTKSDMHEPLLLTLDQVHALNAIQVLQSSRFVYGPTADFDAARQLLKRVPNARQRLSLMGPGGLRQAPTYPAMPMGSWLVVNGRRSHYCIKLDSWHEGDGEIVAKIASSHSAELNQAISDSPLDSVELIQDRMVRRGMRVVEIIRGDDLHRSVRVRHSDPALRTLGRR